MSARKNVTLVCDSCGAAWDDGMTTSIQAARGYAQLEDRRTKPAKNWGVCGACFGRRA